MKRIINSVTATLIAGFVIIIMTNPVTAQPGAEGIVIGKTFQLKSNIFNEERTILVYTPDGYRKSENKYPVLYVLDGYDHFHYVSGMVLSLSRNNKIPKMIVVGIQNPHRNRDFTPRPIAGYPNSGSADMFLRFAEEELFPFIENNYRTEPCRVLVGHSLCGMFSIYTMLKEPGMFIGFIAVSPGAWIDDKYILKYAKEKLEDSVDLNNILYFTVGGDERKEDVEAVKELKTIFETQQPEGLDWHFKLLEGEKHHSVVYMSIYDGLKYIFSDLLITEKIQNSDADEIVEYYEYLTDKFGFEIKVPEGLLNSAGYRHLHAGDIYDAIDAFTQNVELYPNSANAYNSLGEAYETNNQLNLALEYYKKAYEIGGKNRHPNLYYFMQDYENMKKKIRNR